MQYVRLWFALTLVMPVRSPSWLLRSRFTVRPRSRSGGHA